jgi:hypothetical protein
MGVRDAIVGWRRLDSTGTVHDQMKEFCKFEHVLTFEHKKRVFVEQVLQYSVIYCSILCRSNFKFTFALCLEFLLMFTPLPLFNVTHCMSLLNWPFAGVQVDVLKESALLL